MENEIKMRVLLAELQHLQQMSWGDKIARCMSVQRATFDFGEVITIYVHGEDSRILIRESIGHYTSDAEASKIISRIKDTLNL